MKNIFALFTKNQSLIYKVFLFVVATFLVIYLLPKGGQFKYNFQQEVMQKLLKYDIQNTALNQHTS